MIELYLFASFTFLTLMFALDPRPLSPRKVLIALVWPGFVPAVVVSVLIAKWRGAA